MSAFVSTDARTEILRYLEDKARLEKCLALRAGIPLPILLDSVERFLRKAETETAVFIQSMPEIDPETLDPNHRNCAICWDGFKLQSKSRKFSSLSERDSTPLRLPCAHIICKACIQGWLAKSGTCPICHHQCIRREFLGTCDIQRRESYKEFAELAPDYLATIKPESNTYGEFAAWSMIEDSKEDLSLRLLRIRAQFMIRKFNQFPTTLEERLLQVSDGRRPLSPMKIVEYSEDEEQSDKEGDVMEEGGDEEQNDEKGDSTEEGVFEGLAYADDVLEEYGSTDEEEEEEEEPADDDDDDDDDYDYYLRGLLDDGEDAATSTAAAERGEGEEEEEKPTNDDHNEGQFTDESEDATASTTSTTAAAVATVATAILEDEVVKDLLNEDKDNDKDEDGNVNLKPATEIVKAEKMEEKKKKKMKIGWVSFLLLVLINMGCLAMLIMTSENCC